MVGRGELADDVLQDVMLFSGSIADNIALGRDDLDEGARRAALATRVAVADIDAIPPRWKAEPRPV